MGARCNDQPTTRPELEEALQEAREALADKVQEHRRAILREKAAGYLADEIAALRQRIEELKQALAICRRRVFNANLCLSL